MSHTDHTFRNCGNTPQQRDRTWWKTVRHEWVPAVINAIIFQDNGSNITAIQYRSPSFHMCNECPLESPVAIQTRATTVPMFANVLWHIIRANSFNEGVCRWQLHLGQTCLPHLSWQRNDKLLHAQTRGRCQQPCRRWTWRGWSQNAVTTCCQHWWRVSRRLWL